MSKHAIRRSIGGLIVGRRNLDYLAAAARERRHNRREREEVAEAQWNVKTFDWPLSHPDDVSDEIGFQVIGSEAYVAALKGLHDSFGKQPVVGRAHTDREPGWQARPNDQA